MKIVFLSEIADLVRFGSTLKKKVYYIVIIMI